MSEKMSTYVPEFLNPEEAQELFDCLYETAKWQTWKYSPNSRKIAHFESYNLPRKLREVIQRIESEYQVPIMRQAFANLYRDGNDYCPYHSDRYGVDSFTISLGTTRDFCIRAKHSAHDIRKISLNSGDLFIIKKELHDSYNHAIYQSKRVKEPRISVLLFVDQLER